FVERADVRQTRGAVAGFEQDVALRGRLPPQARKHLAGFLIGPGFGNEGGGAEVVCHDAHRLAAATDTRNRLRGGKLACARLRGMNRGMNPRQSLTLPGLLAREMRPGERLLWSGQPDARRA